VPCCLNHVSLNGGLNDHSSSANAFQVRADRRRLDRPRRDHPWARATQGVISLDIARDLLDPDSFVATGIYEDGAALQRQESAPEVHRAMAMFSEALAAPPDRTNLRRVARIQRSSELFAVLPDLVIAVLAAGASRRLGRAKQLVPIGGEPLLRRQCRCALDARIGEVMAILGCDDAQHRQVIIDLPVDVRVNNEWEEGTGGNAPVRRARGEGAAISVARLAVRPIPHHSGRLAYVVQPLALGAERRVRLALAPLRRSAGHSAHPLPRRRSSAARR